VKDRWNKYISRNKSIKTAREKERDRYLDGNVIKKREVEVNIERENQS